MVGREGTIKGAVYASADEAKPPYSTDATRRLKIKFATSKHLAIRLEMEMGELRARGQPPEVKGLPGSSLAAGFDCLDSVNNTIGRETA